jgi:Tfp pilus assembly protein PilE
MHRMIKGIARLRLNKGFTLVEVLVAGLVLVVGLVMMSQFFASAMGRVLDSDTRSILQQVAAQDIEQIRGLPYEKVGTDTGHPHGDLPASEDRTVQSVAVHIQREIIYWTDPSNTNLAYPANYKRVIVTVSEAGQNRLGPVELTTNVAGGAFGGTLDVWVTDVRGDPVPDALITITNNNLSPNVNISSSALRTNSAGHMMIPGLTPDPTPNYVVSVSRAGYNTDFTNPAVVVNEGTVTVVQLMIDLLATLSVHVVDTNGTPVSGLNLSVIGPDGFSQAVVSGGADGVNFANIRYSTDLDPYVVRLLPGQGYDTLSQTIVLEPGTTQEVVFTVPAGGPTTTTTLPPVTTSSTSSTSTTSTTLSGSPSLTVTVLRADNENPIYRARVRLEGRDPLYTNSSGWVSFGSLQNGTYDITVTKNNYQDYQGTVVVNGASVVVIHLTPQN